MDRRGFLWSLAGAGAMLGLGAAARGEAEAALLRPPGGQDERHLLSLCIHCAKCEEICPTGAIVPLRLGSGWINAQTPTLDFHAGYCNLCTLCMEVCPTSALTMTAPDDIRIGLAVIQKDVCIAWDRTGCTKCEEACALDAISLDQAGRPWIDADKCNGCGACVTVCPASRLRSSKGGRRRGVIVEPLAETAGVSSRPSA